MIGPRDSPTQRNSGEARMGGLARAADILGAFDDAHRELPLTELARRSGLPRSTVHRTATTMVALGWLDKPDERYCIGIKLFELSGLAPVRRELREAVLPFLQDLHAATRVTVQLGLLDGVNVVVVEKISGHRPMPMLSQVGTRIPAHCSALGRAILAYSTASVIDSVLGASLERRTPMTVTSPDRLRRELAAIPDRGWAFEREEGNVGVGCVAAPIFGPLGEVSAALSVTGAVSSLRLDRLGPAVRLAASAASRAYAHVR